MSLETGSRARRRMCCLPHHELLRTWLREKPGSFQREESARTELPSGVTQAEPGRVVLHGVDLCSKKCRCLPFSKAALEFANFHLQSIRKKFLLN